LWQRKARAFAGSCDAIALVLLSAWLVLLAVGSGFFPYARRATDGERIYFRADCLVAALENSGKLWRAGFRREWIRVAPRWGDRLLIEMSGQIWLI